MVALRVRRDTVSEKDNGNGIALDYSARQGAWSGLAVL